MATNVVSLAILIMAGAFLVAAVFLFLRAESPAGYLAGFLVLGLAIAVAIGAWAFQLVPLRLQDLEDEAQEYEEEHGPYEFKD